MSDLAVESRASSPARVDRVPESRDPATGDVWHRYEVAQGFQPAEVRLVGRTEGEVLDKASALMGSRPSAYWCSAQNPEWGDRPAAVWVQWNG